jgi:hypothetical protein
MEVAAAAAVPIAVPLLQAELVAQAQQTKVLVVDLGQLAVLPAAAAAALALLVIMALQQQAVMVAMVSLHLLLGHLSLAAEEEEEAAVPLAELVELVVVALVVLLASAVLLPSTLAAEAEAGITQMAVLAAPASSSCVTLTSTQSQTPAAALHLPLQQMAAIKSPR